MEATAPTMTPAPVGVTPKPWGLPAIVGVLALPVLLWASSFFLGVPEEVTVGEIIVGIVSTIVFKDLLFIGLVAGVVIWRYRLSWRELGFRPFDRGLWWMPLVAVTACYIGLIVYSVVITALGAKAPEQEELDPFFESRAVLPLTAFALIVMAPLSEEILFRGFMFAGLIRRFSVPAAMVASGFTFGMFHVAGLDTLALLLPIGLIGTLFAWLYYRTGSLWVNIGAHALFNSVSFLARAAAGSV